MTVDCSSRVKVLDFILAQRRIPASYSMRSHPGGGHRGQPARDRVHQLYRDGLRDVERHGLAMCQDCAIIPCCAGRGAQELMIKRPSCNLIAQNLHDKS